jgi:phosphate transport system permease protein
MATVLDQPAAPPVDGPPEARPVPGPPTPRRIHRGFGRAELGLAAVTLVSAFCAVWLLFTQLTLLSGPFGFLVCWVALFLVLYWLVNLRLHGRSVASDRVVGSLILLAGLAMLVPLVLITGYVVVKGWHLLSIHVLTHDERGVGPLSPAGTAGVGHAIVGTLEEAAIAAAIGVPAGIMTGIYLHEVGGRMARAVRVVVTAMSGVPAIVAGIFIYSIWIVGLGEGFSGFAGSLALAIILLPSVARGTEEVLKVVPDELREAAASVGAHEWRTTWSVVLPTARSGIVTASLMGVARVVGEAAPLLVTIFGNSVINTNPFHGAQEALPLLTYSQIKVPLASAVALGFTAALVLYIIVFLLFLAARLVGSIRLGRGFSLRRSKGGLDAQMEEAALQGVRGGGQYL